MFPCSGVAFNPLFCSCSLTRLARNLVRVKTITESLCSYGVNSDTRDRKTIQVPASSQTPLLLEEGSTQETTNDGFFDLDFSPRDYLVGRHNDGNVFAFCDGHVSWENWNNQDTWQKCDFAGTINEY